MKAEPRLDHPHIPHTKFGQWVYVKKVVEKNKAYVDRRYVLDYKPVESFRPKIGIFLGWRVVPVGYIVLGNGQGYDYEPPYMVATSYLRVALVALSCKSNPVYVDAFGFELTNWVA